MSRRPIWRLRDMKEAIGHIRDLLRGATLEDLKGDVFKMAAYERFLEILSEASRHVPDDWKIESAPDLPWRRIGDLSNAIRHGYHHLDAEVLWLLYPTEIDRHEAADDAMLSRHQAALS